MDLWPDVGGALGIGRSSTYKAAREGEIPTIRLGRRLVVPVARLRVMVGLDAEHDTPADARDGPEAA